jgi:hypothetical protein
MLIVALALNRATRVRQVRVDKLSLWKGVWRVCETGVILVAPSMIVALVLDRATRD